jgi:hypothetical protein
LTSSRGGQGQNVLPSIKNVVRVPLKFVYVLRNPFDVAATKMHRQASMRVEVSERHKLYGSPVSTVYTTYILFKLHFKY